MKLRYTFDTVEMGDEIICVPVGDGADQIHGVVRLNKSGLEIMELLKNEITLEQIVDELAARYNNDREELLDRVQNVIDTLQNAGIIAG